MARCARPECGHRKFKHTNGGVDACRVKPLGHCASFVAEAPPPPPPPPPVQKPIFKGMFTRGGVAAAGSAYSASSRITRWGDCQPVKDGPFDFSKIDQDVATSWARGKPTRLRPMLGNDAPTWAMGLGAGPIQFYEVVNDKTEPIPDIWDPEYQSYAEKFVRALAAHFKDDERVVLAFASAAMTKYAEPLVRGVPLNCDYFAKSPSYSPEADITLAKWQLDIMSDFTQPVGMAYNPMMLCSSTGHTGKDEQQALMAEIMDHQLALYGDVGTVLQNNELGRADTWVYASGTPHWYAEFDKRKDLAVIQFQTAAGVRIADPPGEYDAIKWAKDTFGATGVEDSGGLTDAERVELDAYLKT